VVQSCSTWLTTLHRKSRAWQGWLTRSKSLPNRKPSTITISTSAMIPEPINVLVSPLERSKTGKGRGFGYSSPVAGATPPTRTRPHLATPTTPTTTTAMLLLSPRKSSECVTPLHKYDPNWDSETGDDGKSADSVDFTNLNYFWEFLSRRVIMEHACGMVSVCLALIVVICMFMFVLVGLWYPCAICG